MRFLGDELDVGQTQLRNVNDDFQSRSLGGKNVHHHRTG